MIRAAEAIRRRAGRACPAGAERRRAGRELFVGDAKSAAGGKQPPSTLARAACRPLALLKAGDADLRRRPHSRDPVERRRVQAGSLSFTDCALHTAPRRRAASLETS